MTLRDIANAVGVTPMTVSRALRNQDRISAETRLKIQAKAAEMGYRPDPALTALVHYRRSRLAPPVRAAFAWLNSWSDPGQLRKFKEFDLYWKGAAAAAERQGFHLEEFQATDAMRPARLAQILRTRNVRGILVPPGHLSESWMAEFPWKEFCVVALTRSHDQLPIYSVTADQARNAMLAMGKIREKGYRRIGFVGAPWIKRLFAGGFLWMQLLEIPEARRVPPLLIPHKDSEKYQRAFEKWLRAYRPDAILTESAALPGMLATAGLRVPEDVGLAGLSTLDCPIEAGIYQNPEEIGRVGVLMLQSLMNDNARGLPAISRQVLIEGTWAEGRTLPDRAAARR